MTALDLGGALDTTPAAVADLVGVVDIPCEAENHDENGYGRVEHVARGRRHDGCTDPLVPVCEGCLTTARETIAALRSGPHKWTYCQPDDVLTCVHQIYLVVHPIRCAP